MGRPPGAGWLVLLGGGEFGFGETADADFAWLEHSGGAGSPDLGAAASSANDSTASDSRSEIIGFVPAASGSEDYGRHFATYLDESFDRKVETLPVYRSRDARRGRNAERLAGVSHVYLGGGLPDQLIDALAGTPTLDALTGKLAEGGTVVAIGGAAQALGTGARSLRGGRTIDGIGWLDGVVEAMFDPDRDRRLRQLLTDTGAPWGLGIPAECSVMLGPAGEIEVVGEAWWLDGPDGLLKPLDDFGSGALPIAAPTLH